MSSIREVTSGGPERPFKPTGCDVLVVCEAGPIAHDDIGMDCEIREEREVADKQ